MKYNVEIDPHESAYVEKLFVLHQAKISNVAFLMQYPNIDKDLLKSYCDELDNIAIELNYAKDEISKKYMPEECEGKCDYLFDFENHAMIFEDNK